MASASTQWDRKDAEKASRAAKRSVFARKYSKSFISSRKPRKPRARKTIRSLLTKEEYLDFLATPRHYYEPPKETEQSKPNVKRSSREDCSPRILILAKPLRSRVLETWKNYQDSLPQEFVSRLEYLLDTEYTYDPPEFAQKGGPV